MLGKLLKHEWKAVWKVPTVLIGILMIIALISGLTFALPIWDSEWIGLPLSAMMLFLLFYAAMIGVTVGITIYLAVRYYKNMFADEGYLTHTLPVTSHQLLASKIITMSAWNLIGEIAVLASLFVFAGVAVLFLGAKEGSFAVAVFDVLEAFQANWSTISIFFQGAKSFVVSTLCTMLLGSISSAIMIIGAITLGQMVRRHRVLGSVGAYFAINSLIGAISVVIMLPVMLRMLLDETFMYNFEKSPFDFYTILNAASAVIFLIVAVCLYFLSEYLIRRRLELE